MSDSDSEAAAVPADVLEAINLTRPRCWWWDHNCCKKGARCSFLHGVAASNEAHLPHVSIHKDRDGDVKLNVRPPLHAAWDQFFWQKRIHRTNSSGKHLNAEGNWMMYQLFYMEERDTTACVASATQRCAHVRSIAGDKVRQLGAITALPFPDMMIHGTSIDAALSIICDGHCRPGPGPCGHGIYGFKLDSLEEGHVLKQARRCATGGYNAGAAIIMECAGLLIKCTSDERVPAGAVSCCARKVKENSDQYCAAPQSVNYKAVVFEVRGLLHRLGEHLERSGYSSDMHDALMKAKETIGYASSSSAGAGRVTLSNRFANCLHNEAKKRAQASRGDERVE